MSMPLRGLTEVVMLCKLLFIHLYNYCISFVRHILPSLHFNENVKRQAQVSKEGQEYLTVTYPKFKLGEEVVREVAVPPTYTVQ